MTEHGHYIDSRAASEVASRAANPYAYVSTDHRMERIAYLARMGMTVFEDLPPEDAIFIATANLSDILDAANDAIREALVVEIESGREREFVVCEGD